MGDEEPLDFEALMASQGVEPLKGRKGKARRPPPPPVEPPAPPSPRPTPVPPRAPPDPSELQQARSRIAALEQELTAARKAQKRQQATLQAAKANQRASDRRVTALTAELEALRHSIRPLAGLLQERGVAEGAVDRLFAGWADAGWLSGLLATLSVSDVEGARCFLDRRVSLVCGDPKCPPQAGSVTLTVEASACEVCGGSDIQRAAHAFFDRCAVCGLKRVCIVGGSPTYHTKLKDLAREETRVHLKLVAGTHRRTQRDARLDQKHSDAVILWGGTMLDHSTSNLYDPSLGPVLLVPHRGISRMLEYAAREIQPGR